MAASMARLLDRQIQLQLLEAEPWKKTSSVPPELEHVKSSRIIVKARIASGTQSNLLEVIGDARVGESVVLTTGGLAGVSLSENVERNSTFKRLQSSEYGLLCVCGTTRRDASPMFALCTDKVEFREKDTVIVTFCDSDSVIVFHVTAAIQKKLCKAVQSQIDSPENEALETTMEDDNLPDDSEDGTQSVMSPKDVETSFERFHKAMLVTAAYARVSADETNHILHVTIQKHLHHDETGLPEKWEGYHVAVKYRKYTDEIMDQTDVTRALIWNSIAVYDQTDKIDSFIDHYQPFLSTLLGLTYISMQKLESGVFIMIVFVTDWKHAGAFEAQLKADFEAAFPPVRIMEKGCGFWMSMPVAVIRTEQVLLVRGEEYLEHVLVGSRIGAGGMTSGLLLEDQNKVLYMLQCSHGYNDIGDPVWAPSASTIQSAIDQVGRELSEAPEAKTALYEARKKILEKAREHALVLERPPRTPTYIYSRPNELSALSIGRVCYILPKELDAALIKVRLSSKFGVEKKLCKPRNLLRAPASVSKERNYDSMAEMPKAITGLSTLSTRDLEAKFGKGEERLMKVGARTGFSQFYVGPGSALVDGRRCMEIIPVIGGRVFSEQVIIDPGDSSAPVFDAHGIVHGMVSAKLKYEEVGFIVLMSDIIKAAAEKGYDLSLA